MTTDSDTSLGVFEEEEAAANLWSDVTSSAEVFQFLLVSRNCKNQIKTAGCHKQKDNNETGSDRTPNLKPALPPGKTPVSAMNVIMAFWTS